MNKDTLIVGFSKSKGFKPFSWLIRLFEGTKYSHNYLKISNNYFLDFDIYQASKNMVNHVVEKHFLEENAVVAEFSIPVDLEQKKAILNYARHKLGRPYSTLTIAGIFLSKFGIHINSLFKGEQSYICSELVARALKDSGLLPTDIYLDIDKATPKQMYEICELYFNRIK